MNDELTVVLPEIVKKAVAADLKSHRISYTKLGEMLGIKRASAANLMADKTKYFNRMQAFLLHDSFGYALSYLEKGQGTLYKEIDPLRRQQSSNNIFKRWATEETPTIIDTLGSVIHFSFNTATKENVGSLEPILSDANHLYSLYEAATTLLRANLQVDEPYDIKQTIEAFQRMAKPLIDSIHQKIEKEK